MSANVDDIDYTLIIDVIIHKCLTSSGELEELVGGSVKGNKIRLHRKQTNELLLISFLFYCAHIKSRSHL